MRLALAAIALVLTGCGGSDQPHGVARNLTIGTGECSKYKWGTAQMAECLDRVAERQTATISGGKAGESS